MRLLYRFYAGGGKRFGGYTESIMICTLRYIFLMLFLHGAAHGLAAGQQTTPALAGVVRVENAGLLFTDNTAGVNGTDAGYSVPLDSQTLWLFGDVFLQNPTSAHKPFAGGVSNCGLLASRGKGPAALKRYEFLTDPDSGMARQLIPRLPDEDDKVRLWPFGGWYSALERRVYLYYARVRVTGGGPLDFRAEGYGLAAADARNPKNLAFKRLRNAEGSVIWWPAGAGRPVFGSAVLARGDKLYVFGYQDRGFRKFGKLARVRQESVSNSRAYEFFSGTPESPAWSADPGLASDIQGLTDFPTELSVSYNMFLGGFLGAHSQNLGEKARLSLASSPWGPYRVIGDIDTRHQPFAKAFCYAGKEHPEMAEEHGRIVYLTYVDSSRYWLRLLKVTLSK